MNRPTSGKWKRFANVILVDGTQIGYASNTVKEYKANARLFTASLNLFTVAQLALKFFDDMSDGGFNSGAAVRDQIRQQLREAIKQVKGGKER